MWAKNFMRVVYSSRPDEVVPACERSMRGWDRHCAGTRSLEQWMRGAQKSNRCWLILFIVVGLVLCWDVTFPQGCSGEESCSRLFSSHAFVRSRNHGQHTASSLTLGHESHVQRETKDQKALSHQDHPQDVGAAPASLVDAAVSFNDSILLILSPPFPGLRGAALQARQRLKCVYAGGGVHTRPLSVEDGFVGCKHPQHVLRKSPASSSTVAVQIDGSLLHSSGAMRSTVSWKRLVYGWAPLPDEGDALLFVKGLAHSKRSLLPEGLECQYGDSFRTKVVAFCQENVRCRLPPAGANRQALIGKPITLALKDTILPSVVRFSPPSALDLDIHSHGSSDTRRTPRFLLCACTLVWNGAKFLPEWVMYHGHVGVQRFFLYDNNSDDDIEDVLRSLQFFNVSRHPWPWLKTQEASFAHCAVRAAQECTWVAFIDLDEFVFPKRPLASEHGGISEPPLHAIIRQYDAANMGKLGQLKLINFNFGPSGLRRLPRSGQMVNYVCRMKVPRRVKSIVRASAIHPSYCSRVHHFEMRGGYVSAQAVRDDAVIHHYKYQVWEDFRLKFVRRAATFVADWGQNKNLESFDRTPGLGTQAVEPPDWAHQFCEIEDTALREYVMNAAELHFEGKLLWE